MTSLAPKRTGQGRPRGRGFPSRGIRDRHRSLGFPGRQLLDQGSTLNLLGGGGPGDGRHQGHPSRMFIGREAADAVCAEIVECRRCGGVRSHHHCTDQLAPLRIGKPDDGDLGDPDVLGEDRLDLERRHRFPARADHVLGPPGDRQEPFGIALGQVAVRYQPSTRAAAVASSSSKYPSKSSGPRTQLPSGSMRISVHGAGVPQLPGLRRRVLVAERRHDLASVEP